MTSANVPDQGHLDLPVMPPVSPMLAKPAKAIPLGMHYEGKWDGFRAIIFRDGDEVVIGSRNEKPLTRYFPEVVALARAGLPDKCVVDGEIVIARDGRLDFDALLNRIHPADSRVQLLAEQTPAQFVSFDLLAIDDRNLMSEEFGLRRDLLVQRVSGRSPGIHVTPATRDADTAALWFEQFEGAGLDGIIAKSLSGAYEPNKRAMIKIKDLMRLTQGSVVELDRIAGEPLDLLVNNSVVAQGEIVLVNDRYGVRLTRVVPSSERLKLI